MDMTLLPGIKGPSDLKALKIDQLPTLAAEIRHAICEQIKRSGGHFAPNLGVVDCGDYRSFVVADIPGLIDGAHEGAGLGLRFLPHVERCGLLLHLVDPTAFEREPVAAVEALDHELTCHSAELAGKEQIIVATKADAVQERERVDALRDWAAARELQFFEISAVSGTGLQKLIAAVATRLERTGRKL